MKKVLLLILAVAMLFCFAACGDKTDKEGNNDSANGNTDSKTEDGALKILDTEYALEDYAICIAKDNTELRDAIDEALVELIDNGTVKKIVDKYISGVEHDLVFQQDVAEDAEELHMATNAEFPPYEFYEGGAVVGIDAEVAAAIADKLGCKLVIDDMDFTAIIAAVQSGKSDFGMAGMTVTEERLESVDFTTSYATGVQVVVVKEGGRVTSVDDLFELGDVIVGVQESTTGDIYATGDIEDEGLGTIMRYNKGADAIEALKAGKVDCVIIDNEPAKEFVAANS